MAEKLVRQIDNVINFKEKGFDQLMVKYTRLQQGAVASNKVAQRLATGKGRVSKKDIGDAGSFMGASMSDFQKQNLSFLAQIAVNTQGAAFSKVKNGKKPSSSFMEKLVGDIENRKTKGILRTKTDITKPTGATSIGGVLTSLLTTINPMIVVGLGLLTAIVGLLASASKMLQRTLGNIFKFIMMFIRPIGDMLAVLLYPLMMVLRPLALMMNTMVRPFLREARRSFRLGLQLGRQSDEARAEGQFGIAGDLENISEDMFATGIAALAAGFGKLLTNMLGGVIKLAVSGMIEVIMIPMSLLAGVIDGLTGGAWDLTGVLDSAKQAAVSFVESGIDGVLKDINDGFDDVLSTISAKNDAVATLSTNVGDWLDNTEDLSGVDLTTVLETIEDIIDEFEKANKIGTEDAFKTAKENMVLLGTTIEGVIDGLISKYTLGDDTSPPPPPGGGGGFGGGEGGGDDWWSSTISTVTGLFTDLTSPIDEVQKALDGDLKGAIFDFVAGPLDEISIAYADLFDSTVALYTEDMNLTEEVKNNISAMNIFRESTSSAISAIDGAVESAKNFAADAATSLARQKSLSNLNSDNKGGKATGGSVDQNGMYYLHRGETVTNPVDSSFNNTSGGNSGGGNITINMNNSTFGNFDEWKREMDKYFSQQMRHMR